MCRCVRQATALVSGSSPSWCLQSIQPHAGALGPLWALPRQDPALLKTNLFGSWPAGTSIPQHRGTGAAGRTVSLVTLMALCKCCFPFARLRGLKVPFLSLSLSLSDGDFADNCKETASFNTPHLSRGVWLCRPF